MIHNFHTLCRPATRSTRAFTNVYRLDAHNLKLYEISYLMQGRNMEYEGLPVSEPLSTGVHESQSLLWERMVAGSLPFCHYLLPIIKEHFPEFPATATVEDLYRAMNVVQEPSLVRTESDEVTYPMHVILRYELERDLIDGKIQVGAAASFLLASALGFVLSCAYSGVLFLVLFAAWRPVPLHGWTSIELRAFSTFCLLFWLHCPASRSLAGFGHVCRKLGRASPGSLRHREVSCLLQKFCPRLEGFSSRPCAHKFLFVREVTDLEPTVKFRVIVFTRAFLEAVSKSDAGCETAVSSETICWYNKQTYRARFLSAESV
jgi:hypothetical protein